MHTRPRSGTIGSVDRRGVTRRQVFASIWFVAMSSVGACSVPVRPGTMLLARSEEASIDGWHSQPARAEWLDDCLPGYRSSRGKSLTVRWTHVPDPARLVQTLVVLASSGAAPPELVDLDPAWAGRLTRFTSGPLLALESYLRGPSRDFVNEAFSDPWTVGGHVIALGSELNVALLGYRVDVWSVAGVRAPLVTWDDAIEAGRLPANSISTIRRGSFLKHKDSAIRERAAKLFEAAGGDRMKAFEEAKSVLTLTPNGAHGREVFKNACSMCHRLDQEGHAVGPDLFDIRRQPKENILFHIIVTDAEIAPQFAAYIVETKDGRLLSGILASETPTSITLRGPLAQETNLLRSDIAKLEAAPGSLMPNGLETTMSKQDLADLLSAANRELGGGHPEAYRVPATRKLVAQSVLLFRQRDLEPYVSHDFRRANIVVRHSVRDSSTLY